MADPLARWLEERAPAVLARAEEEAVALLRDELVRAALAQRQAASPKPAGATAEPPAPRTTPPAARPATATGELLWAYGVVDAEAALPLEGLRGVDGQAPIERVESGGLAALVSRVPRATFDAEPLREHLDDLAWLEQTARAHEAILDVALGAATVVPLRLCTIYESPERVRAMLGGDRAALTEALAFLAGREEWGAKVLIDAERLAEHARAGDDGDTDERDVAPRSEGGAYLERRRQDRHLRERVQALAAHVAEDAHARLGAHAVEAVRQPPQNRELSGHQGEMVLNAAYLLDAGAVGALRREAAALEAEHGDVGAHVEVTGPWPPYNFLPRHGAAAQP